MPLPYAMPGLVMIHVSLLSPRDLLPLWAFESVGMLWSKVRETQLKLLLAEKGLLWICVSMLGGGLA